MSRGLALVLATLLAPGLWAAEYSELRLRAFRAARKARARGATERARKLYARAASQPRGTPELQERALDRLNQHRFQAMLVPVLYHPAVARAARAHAAYLGRHTETRALTLEQAHGEVPGREGFTGQKVGDRLEHQGLAGSSTEAVTSETDPEGAVDILMNSVYHRSALLRQEARYAGFGASSQAVLDLFWEPGTEDGADLVRYPGPGQTGVPPRFPGGETPEPLPGAVYPVGPPISLGASGAAPRVRSLHLRGPGGAVPLEILTPARAPMGELLGDYVYAVPRVPLEPGTSYRVEVEFAPGEEPGLLPGKQPERTLRWSFRTGEKVPGEQFARIGELVQDLQELAPGRPVRYQVTVEASHPAELRLRWSVDGAVVADGPERECTWEARAGNHRLQVLAYYPTRPGAYMQKEFSLFVPGAGVERGELPPEFTLSPAPPWEPGQVVELRALPPPGAEEVRYRFQVDGQILGEGSSPRAHWEADGGNSHQFRVRIDYRGGSVTRFLTLSP